MSRPPNLYGLEGAEQLDRDPETVYELHIEPDHDPDWLHSPTEYQIEEWSTRPVRELVPDLGAQIEYIAEVLSEAIGDDDFERFDKARQDPDVIEAFQAAARMMADKTGFLVADNLVATHAVTFDAEGEPLLDGEPMYRTIPKESA